MKISIIIPAYNEEKYIAKTIDAVLHQTYSDFEIIVVNNNSTDRTVDIVMPYLQESRVQLVTEKRQGLLFARAAGLHASTGEIIAQLDADCIPPKDWLARGGLCFENEAIVGVCGPYDYYDAQWYTRMLSLAGQKAFFSLTSWYVQKKKKGAVLVGGNSFIRRSALIRAGGYNTDLHFYAEDTDTACRIAKFGRVMYVRSLVVKTSARRYATQGFFTILKKYFEVFFMLMRGRPISNDMTVETIHPR